MLIPLGILDYPAPTAAGSYDLLQTEILTGSQASVTFSSLNSTYGSTYQHLQIRYTTKVANASLDSYMNVTFNTGGTYRGHSLFGNGSTVTSTDWGSSILCGFTAGGSGSVPSTTFGAGVLDILDPFNSSKNTTIRDLSGRTQYDPRVGLSSGAWFDTAALTSITLDAEGANNFVTGSRFSLYGWKAA